MHKGGAVPGRSVPFGAVWGRGGLRMPLSALRGWALAVLAALAPAERSRPYAVLQKQNLVLLGSILSALLLTIVLVAVCVYKPVRRR
uniref:Uncharacterized protein n=2 Tax=Anatidae TaxID=8830 RepID=A0A8C3GNE0_CAIMO